MSKLATSLVLAILGTASVASADPILALDFGLAGGGATEPGFTPFLVSNPGTAAQRSQTFGSITVSFTGTTLGGRDRGGYADSGAFTYGDLLRDLLTSINETSTGTSMQIAGLAPSTPYELRIWSLDKGFNDGSIYKWYDTTSTPVLVGEITNDITPTFVDNNSFSIAFQSTTDNTGAIRLGHSDPMGTGTINALTITAVPEPTTLALTSLALAGLMARRRRH